MTERSSSSTLALEDFPLNQSSMRTKPWRCVHCDYSQTHAYSKTRQKSKTIVDTIQERDSGTFTKNPSIAHPVQCSAQGPSFPAKLFGVLTALMLKNPNLLLKRTVRTDYSLRNTNSSIDGTAPIFSSTALLGSSSTPMAIMASLRGESRPTLMKLMFTFS